jgi:hypothetical protein
MARSMTGLWALVLALMLAGCGAVGDDGTPDYRYRLTVEVETPDGPRTGSSVIEVEQRMGRSAGTGFGKKIMRRVRAEAVAVDLPGGRTLYALLRSDDNVDWAANVMQMLAPEIEGEPWEDVFDNVLLVEGEVEVPRMWPPIAPFGERSAYPMLVTFGDESDPASVARVDPDDLAATFGENYELGRVTVELTDDPVTTGIEERLPWLSDYPEPSLSPDHGPRDFSLPATLKHGDFRKGTE